MKKSVSKKRSFKIAAVLAVASIIGIYPVIYGIKPVYAENIVIAGDAAGSLSIVSTDKMLFNLAGLYPGDRNSSSVTISNEDMINDGFDVYMFAENTAEDSFDLGRVTRLKVTDDSTVIYDGMLINFDENINSTTPVYLGRLPRGTDRIFDFEIEIDGLLTGNDYQDRQSNFSVTFAAYSYGAPVTPDITPPPTTPPTETDTSTDDISEPDTESGIPFASLISFVPEQNIPEQIIPEQVIPEQDIIVPEEEITVPDVELEDLIVPLAGFEFPNDDNPDPSTQEPVEDEPDTVELNDAEVPLANKEMPKTGEIGLAVYIIPGVILICFGMFLVRGMGKSRTKRRRH